MNPSLMLRRSIGLVVVSIFANSSAHAIAISSSISDGITGITLPFGDGSVRIPLAGNVMGKAFGEAAAGTTPVTAVLTELKPSAGPGVILAAGPPPVGGQVAYPATTNTHSNAFGSATATTRGLIRGTPSGPGGGVINMVTIVGLTPTSAATSGVAFSVATARVNTDPVILEPLAAPESTMLMVDLLSNYPSDPTASFSLSAFAFGPDPAEASAHFDLRATTNIPGLSTLFSLAFDLDANASKVDVFFTSPVMSSPISSSDFTSTGTGSFALNLAKTKFAVPFTIPAGTLGTDPSLGSVGLVLDIFQSTESIAAVSEPSSLALVLIGTLMLFGCARRVRGVRAADKHGKFHLRETRRTGAHIGAGVAAVFALVSASHASVVSADATTGYVLAAPGSDPKSTLFVFSLNESFPFNPELRGPNASSYRGIVPTALITGAGLPGILSLESLKGAVATPYLKSPLPVAMSGDPAKPLVAICVKNKCPYFPSVTDGPQTKVTAATGIDFANSSSPPAPAPSRVLASGDAAYIPAGVFGPPRPNPALIAADGFVANRIDGKAAGAAYDPYLVSPGSYPVNPIVNARLQLNGPMDFGGVTFFATDDRTFDPDTFYESGQPFELALWSLSVLANGNFVSSSDLLDPSKLEIDFTLKDPALLSIRDSGGGAYSDSMIENAVRKAFTLDGDTVALSNFSVFPVDVSGDALCGTPGHPLCGSATYHVDSLINYGEGVNVGISQVPEPPALALLAAAICACFFSTQRTVCTLVGGRKLRRVRPYQGATAVDRCVSNPGNSIRRSSRLIPFLFFWLCCTSLARADGDFDQAKFNQLATEWNSGRFAVRQEAQRQLTAAARKTGEAGGLTFNQLAMVQSLIFNGPSLEVQRRAETIMETPLWGLPAAAVIRDNLGVQINPATGFIRVDAAEGRFDTNDNEAKAAAAALQRKWFAILANISAGNFNGAVTAYNDYNDFVVTKLKPADFNKLNLKKNNQNFSVDDLRSGFVDADRGFSDLRGQIQNKGANPDPGNRPAIPVPNGTGLNIIPNQPNQSLRLSILGNAVAGTLSVFGPTPENAMSIPPPGYEYVGEIYDLSADQALLISGEIRIGIEYGEQQLIGNPVVDPSRLHLVCIANGDISFLDYPENREVNDLGNFVLFSSYFTNSADAGLDQFGEFAIVQAVPEPGTFALAIAAGAAGMVMAGCRRRRRDSRSTALFS